MSFANPLFLYGLFALAIPVLIHLFNFRRYTRIWFTNVRFLQEIKQETQGRSRLKQWLLLAIRLLIIASIVIAFSQPFLPSKLQHQLPTSTQVISIYVDNSFSMDAVGKEGKLLEQARKKAGEIADGYGPSDRFQLLTNDFEANHQRLVSRDEFMQLVARVDLSPSLRKLPDVLVRQHELLSTEPETSHAIYLISDFQQSTCDLDHLQPDSTTAYFFLPLAAVAASNLFIDTVFFESSVQQPDHISRLRVRIQHTGSTRLEKIPVKLFIDGKQQGLASVDLDAGSETEITLPFRNGIQKWSSGYIELLDYPVVFDDKCYLAYPLITRIPILEIYSDKGSPYLSALYETDSVFQLKQESIRQLDYASFSHYSLIIIDQVEELSSGLTQALARFARDGGDVLMILPKDMDYPSYSAIFATIGIPEPGRPDTNSSRVTSILIEHPLFADVFEPDATGKVEIPENTDMPVVHYHYPFPQNARVEPLLSLQNGDAFLSKTRVGEGACYMLTSPLTLSATNFPGHLLFIPVFLRVALLSQPFPHLYYVTGNNNPIEPPTSGIHHQEVYTIEEPGKEMKVIPEIKRTGERTLLYPHGQIREAGIYQLIIGEQPIANLAFNYPREESMLDYWDAPIITSKMKNYPRMNFALLDATSPSLSHEIRDAVQGRPLWKWFLVLTLLFLFTEIGIIHFSREH